MLDHFLNIANIRTMSSMHSHLDRRPIRETTHFLRFYTLFDALPTIVRSQSAMDSKWSNNVKPARLANGAERKMSPGSSTRAPAQAASMPEPARRHRSQPSSKPAAQRLITLRLTYNNRAADFAREAREVSEPVPEPSRRRTKLKITYKNREADHAAWAAEKAAEAKRAAKAKKAVKAEEVDPPIAPELLRLMKLQLFLGAWTTDDDRTEGIWKYVEDKIATEAKIKSEPSPEFPRSLRQRPTKLGLTWRNRHAALLEEGRYVRAQRAERARRSFRARNSS